MKAARILPFVFLAFLPFAQSCGEAMAAESVQGNPKKAKPDVTYTGKIEQWGVVENGSIYCEIKGKNMKGEEGSIWVKASPSKGMLTGLAHKVLMIVLHYDGEVTIEGKKRRSMNGSTALKAMDLLKIGHFKAGG